jgi:hypothetical protein
MPNIRGLIAPKRILGNIGCMVPDSLEGATDKNEIQITGHILRVRGSPDYQPFTDIGRDRVQLLIAGFEGPRERAISFCKSPYAIAKNR